VKPPRSKSKDIDILEDFIGGMLSDSDTPLKSQTQTLPVEKKMPATDVKSKVEPVVPLPNQKLAKAAPLSVTANEAEVDDRLNKVKNLLANIPSQLGVKESNPEVPQEASNVVQIEQTVRSIEQLTESSEPIEAPLAAKQEQPKLSSDRELMEQDVSREVARAKEVLGNQFQTLIFDVGKLPLAVPLIKLGGIHAYSEEDITPMFGTPDWFKGLLPSEHGNIMLVDTAKFIMPEKYDEIEQDLDYKYAILLDDTRWALSCSSVREAKTLSIDDIRWAQQGSKKEWFAGMVVQFMCALLEVDSLINLLYTQGKKTKN
jgi:purine-binding chemotaxis protein CheW